MKILQTSDLHIGKRINEYSMLEEQEYILNQIIDIVNSEAPDAIVLAGDIYDKSVPSAEAVSLFDDFLVSLAKNGKPVFIISGNHDSAERIAFASRIMESSKVYLSPVFDGSVKPIVLNDGTTEVAFYLLPFIKPALVQHYAGEDVEIKSYNDALKYVVGTMDIDKKRRNVLVSHQFITGSDRSESEDIAIGGLDNVDASVFKDFDYVALGHLHRPQNCTASIRYSGSPLKYSFSEVNDKKSLTIVEINGNEAPVISEHPLHPLHDWHDLRGTYEELTSKAFYDGKGYDEDFVRITLTDEDDIPDGMRKLRTIYHRLMVFQYDNKRTRAGETSIGTPLKPNDMNPGELFAELFEKQNAQPMSDEQQKYVSSLISTIFNEKQ